MDGESRPPPAREDFARMQREHPGQINFPLFHFALPAYQDESQRPQARNILDQLKERYRGEKE